MSQQYQEIEVKFSEIDDSKLIDRLKELGAEDKGLKMLREIIFYDAAGKWVKEERKMVRIRDTGDKITVSFKHRFEDSINGMKEVEFTVTDKDAVEQFLIGIGLIRWREQEKRRHTFQFGEITIDIEYWPGIPAYVELEGPSEEAIKRAAEQLGFDWKNVVIETAGVIIEKIYKIPVEELHSFTFDKIE